MRHNSGTVSAWTRAAHPLPVLAVTAVAAGLAASYGHSWGQGALLTAAVFFGQLSVGWLNDLADARRDALTGRRDKPVAQGLLAPAAVRAATAGAATATLLLSLLCGWQAALVHLAALLSAWAYDLGLKATRASVLAYAASFGLLPAFIHLALPGAPWPPLWQMAAGALLGCSAHFLNALPDLADDAATGVRGLPQRLGQARSRVTAAALALGATALLALAGPSPIAPLLLALAAATLAAGLLRARRPGSRAAFNAILLVALLNVALLLTST